MPSPTRTISDRNLSGELILPMKRDVFASGHEPNLKTDGGVFVGDGILSAGVTLNTGLESGPSGLLFGKLDALRVTSLGRDSRGLFSKVAESLKLGARMTIHQLMEAVVLTFNPHLMGMTTFSDLKGDDDNVKTVDKKQRAEPILEDITEAEWESFKEKVKGADNKVVVLVHPFYRQTGEKTYDRVIAALLQQSMTPVIILEEVRNFKNTRERFPHHMVLPTNNNDPELKQARMPYGPQYMGYSALAEVLKNVGAREIYVGGMVSNTSFAEIKEVVEERKRFGEKGWNVTSFPLTGCAGFVYLQLLWAKGFDKIRLFNTVRLLSNALYPDKPVFERKGQSLTPDRP